MFQKIAKHRANDASNDVHRPPLAQVDQGLLTLSDQAASPRMQIFGLEWNQEVLEEHVRLQTWA